MYFIAFSLFILVALLNQSRAEQGVTDTQQLISLLSNYLA
ncbi:MAG: hypothetical protein ACI89W_001442 [Gammaproteobacteria bacterium]|jgi:hypothetical protein